MQDAREPQKGTRVLFESAHAVWLVVWPSEDRLDLPIVDPQQQGECRCAVRRRYALAGAFAPHHVPCNSCAVTPVVPTARSQQMPHCASHPRAALST